MGEQLGVEAKGVEPAKSGCKGKLLGAFGIAVLALLIVMFGVFSTGALFPQIVERSAILFCNGGIASANIGNGINVYCTDVATGVVTSIKYPAIGQTYLTYFPIIYVTLMVMLHLGKPQRRKVARSESYPRILLVAGAMLLAMVSSTFIMGVGMLFPPIINVASPFTCLGQTVVNAGPYSYGAGTADLLTQFYCVAKGGERIDVTDETYMQAALVYFGVTFLVTYFLNAMANQINRATPIAPIVAGAGSSSVAVTPPQAAPVFEKFADTFADAFDGGVGNDWGAPPSAGWGEGATVLAGERLTAEELEVALVKLEDLRVRGVITEQEHQVKRAEFLARM